MNWKALRWAGLASLLVLAAAACTIEESDPDEDGGTGGGGQTGGTGGGDAGTGGGDAGTGGGDGGTGGGDGGTGGETGGSGGGEGCDPGDNECSQCMAESCCDEMTACAGDAFCPSAVECWNECAGDAVECAEQCDDGEQNVAWNSMFNCLSDSCGAQCL